MYATENSEKTRGWALDRILCRDMQYSTVECVLVCVVMCAFCERFGVCDIDVICSSKQWKLQADIDMDIRAGMILELIMIRDGLWRFSGDFFVPEDVHALACLCID